jgi:hypothetical protein
MPWDLPKSAPFKPTRPLFASLARLRCAELALKICAADNDADGIREWSDTITDVVRIIPTAPRSALMYAEHFLGGRPA